MEEEDSQFAKLTEIHDPDGREIDVKSILQLVKDIILITNEAQEKPKIHKEFDNLTWCRALLTDLETKMQGMSDEVDKQTITSSIHTELAHYSWDAKAVLVLASFAMSHGIWMLAQMHSASSPSLKAEDHDNLYTSLSCRIPKISDLDAYYFYLSMICSLSKRPKKNQLPKPALAILFQALVEVVECIIQLQELPSADLQGNVPSYKSAMHDIPVTVCSIIDIVIYCTTVIRRLPNNDYEISGAEENELSLYASELGKRTGVFKDQIGECNKFLDETKVDPAYQIPLSERDRTDNRRALEFLIKGSGDQRLQNDADIIISQLKEHHVILLISDEKSPQEELLIIEQIFTELTSRTYRGERFSILWIPLYSGLSKESIDYHFKSQKRVTKWFTIPHPSMISTKAAELIKEKWQFQSKTNILVVLDPQGMVLNINAFHMICIWGTEAFPFTRSKERALWKSAALNMEFILNGIDPRIFQWIQEGKYIFLFGGDDIEWIRKFATSTKRVINKFNIPMELLYVGKPKEGLSQTRKNKINKTITEERLCYQLSGDMETWFFWIRLRSMLISKMSHQRGQEAEDRMTRELKWLLGYETARSWALLAKGSMVVKHGPGHIVMEAVIELDENDKSREKGESFEDAFVRSHDKIASRERLCCQVEFPVESCGMPETLRCPKPNCNLEIMDKRIVFQCCHPRIEEQFDTYPIRKTTRKRP